MANTIAYAQIFQEILDEQMIQEMTTAWMESNQNMVKYNGGNTVRIPKMSTTGLGDYSRSAGYVAGSVVLEWETHTFDKDRGTTFNLDAMDVDESNFVATASSVMSEFQKDNVIPEVDSYRYAKIFQIANLAEKTTGYTPLASTIFAALKADIAKMQDIFGEKEALVISMSVQAASILDQADKIDKMIRYDEFVTGQDVNGKPIASKIGFLDNIPIMRISSDRLKSAYTFSATDGYAPTAGALDINWEICARRSIIAIVKQDIMRIFDPVTNQDANAWKMDYRKYHTLIIPDNKVDGLLVNYTPVAAPALTATVAGGVAAGSTKFTATATVSLAYTMTDVADIGSLGIKPVGGNAYISAADIPGAVVGQYLNMYDLDANGLIVKFSTQVLAGGDIT